MTLHVEVDLPGRLQVRLAIGAGVTAVVGPNGSGKSTLLGAVAGTAAGRVTLDDVVWTGRPPQRRRVGLVPQDHQLFPHLGAADNVAFGPRARGTGRRAARELAADWLGRLGLVGLEERRPHELSGGQAQRVALARALATEPRALLLDEPFAALDVSVAFDLREVLREHLRRFEGPVLLTTHDPLDVTELADRVVVLEDGHVVQDGPLEDVAEAPASSHAAQLLGLNTVRGTTGGDGVVTVDERLALVGASRARGAVVATFAPSAVTLTTGEPTGSARNAWAVRVVGLAPLEAAVRVHLRTEFGWDLRADVTPGAVEQLGLAPGAPAWASVKATEVTVFSAARPGAAGAPPR